TAIDTMQIFSNFEESAGISALYNITTRYFHDGLMSNFYVGSGTKIDELKNDGHILASHSVGHFPDFDNETLFPLGNLGNTSTNYNPHYTSGSTAGGSVLGEVEVSKALLEADHNVAIKSFRPGHLAYNDSLALGLEMTNYEFSSSMSANNVLTSFPYYAMKVRTFDGIESSILEIPMTISDVYNGLDATNYSNLVTIWVNVTHKYHANHSPVVLLIHPNRTYKLTAEMDFLNQLPSNTLIYPFQKYGEFWRKRDSLQFHTELANDSLVVQFDNNLLAETQSFVIDFEGLASVQFIDQDDNVVYFDWIPWDNGSRLYFQEETMRVATHVLKKEQLSIYPNPTHEQITIDFQQYHEKVILSLYDLSGRIIYSVETSGRKKTISLSSLNIEPGLYIIIAKFPGKTLRGKVIFQN
ncbi:MAG TPA: T9SS type A sorting domain-containing protein, partial [Flavobacteriaceae bacterium]|nr:T9SS type A sorting domain-containing protein [Flavobacteriaceae bacterium]